MNSGPDDAGIDQEVRDFVEHLSREERLLVVLKRELYDGRWDDMEADLRARLEGEPYIFKLVNRINEDLGRVGRLRAFESDHRVDLGGLVALES